MSIDQLRISSSKKLNSVLSPDFFFKSSAIIDSTCEFPLINSILDASNLLQFSRFELFNSFDALKLNMVEGDEKENDEANEKVLCFCLGVFV